MRILKNNDEEKQQIIDMWKYCFSDSDNFIDWNFSRNFDFSQTLVAERNGEIAANLQLIPYNAKILGEKVQSVYYSGVACRPQFRQQGCVRELMTNSLKMLKAKKIPIAHLIPFNFGFYEKYGFKAVSNRCVLKLDISEIPYSTATEFEVFASFDKVTSDTFTLMEQIYNDMCKNSEFYIMRTAENFGKILEDIMLNSGGYLAVSDESYILYEINNDKITVFETAFRSAKGFRQALGYIGLHKAERKLAEICTILNPIIKTELCDIKNILSLNPYAMLRIIDAEYVLGLLAKRRNTEFSIKLSDKIIPENNSCFEITHGKVKKTENEFADIKTDISVLSQLISGFISLSEACEIGVVTVLNPQIIEISKELFTTSENYVNLML